MTEQEILSPEELISIAATFLGQNIEISGIRSCSDGLVNQTYCVETPQQRYILQAFNAVFTAETVQDSALITDYLHQSAGAVGFVGANSLLELISPLDQFYLFSQSLLPLFPSDYWVVTI